MTSYGRRIMTGFMVALLVAAPAASLRGQGNFEVIPFIGYTLSEGIDFDPQDAGGGIFYNQLTPKSNLAWGLQGEYIHDSGFGFGFLYSDQPTKLEVGIEGTGANKVDATDMHVRNYHGYFSLNFARPTDEVRPFLLFGLGATQYSFSPIMGNDIEGSSRLTGTLGGGVKFYPSEHFGFRGMARWTPTYINSDPSGIWCSPYWWGACWIVSEANFSHQFEMTGGLIIRF